MIRIGRNLIVAAWCVSMGSPLVGALPDDPWRRATPHYRLEFPRDHASHPDYKIEWWYYTGNLATREGRRFGYQVTFFRLGVQFQPATLSRWAIRDLFITHLAISDLRTGRFHFVERINRGGVGQAGADPDRYRVWNEAWEAQRESDGRHSLRADGGSFGVNLTLEEGKGPVKHGRDGFSQKGAEPGNATHYYSLTRMPTGGTLRIENDRFEVEGASWMDHEFGTSFLEPTQRGWDWFSIQLEDGTDLMLFQLRRRDGSRDPHSSGTLIAQDGKTTAIGIQDFELEPQERWKSPVSAAAYPVQWRLSVPSEQLVLTVTPALRDQELALQQSSGVTYWEGAIDVAGTRRGRPVGGRGYLELTGYAGRPLGSVFR